MRRARWNGTRISEMSRTYCMTTVESRRRVKRKRAKRTAENSGQKERH